MWPDPPVRKPARGLLTHRCARQPCHVCPASMRRPRYGQRMRGGRRPARPYFRGIIRGEKAWPGAPRARLGTRTRGRTRASVSESHHGTKPCRPVRPWCNDHAYSNKHKMPTAILELKLEPLELELEVWHTKAVKDLLSKHVRECNLRLANSQGPGQVLERSV